MNTILKAAAAAIVAGVAFTGAAHADQDRDPFMKFVGSSNVVGSAELSAADTDRDPFGVKPVQGEVKNSGQSFSVSRVDSDRNPFGQHTGTVAPETLLAGLGQ